MCPSTTRTCGNTCARGAGTHGDVLNLHTEVFGTDTWGRGRRGERGEGGSPSVLLTKKSPRRVLTWPHRFTERNPLILPIQGLRIDREQLVPESSNHSLHLMNLFIFSNLEESAHTTDTNTNTKTQTPTQQTQTPTQRHTQHTQHTHTHTHQHIPTDPPTQHHSPPPPSPPPRTRTRKRTCTCTCICVCACICICRCVSVRVCVCVYMHM